MYDQQCRLTMKNLKNYIVLPIVRWSD